MQMCKGGFAFLFFFSHTLALFNQLDHSVFIQKADDKKLFGKSRGTWWRAEELRRSSMSLLEIKSKVYFLVLYCLHPKDEEKNPGKKHQISFDSCDLKGCIRFRLCC